MVQARVQIDSGKEFSGHRGVGETLGAEFYCATPYASSQLGLNDHTNGLLRQYSGKGCSCSAADEPLLARVQDWLNDRPRKAPGFRIPASVFGSVRAPA